MSRIRPLCLDADSQDRSSRADILLREEPDEEEEDDPKEDDDDGDNDEGYSE